jgi:hypothetical protein
LIPSDVELPYGSIWRKNNNCLKRTIIVSIYVVVVYGVMSHKSPCPGINSIKETKKRNVKHKKSRMGKAIDKAKKIKKANKIKKEKKQIEHFLKRMKKMEKKLEEQGSSDKTVRRSPRKKRKKEDHLKLVLSVKEFIKRKDIERRKKKKSKQKF